MRAAQITILSAFTLACCDFCPSKAQYEQRWTYGHGRTKKVIRCQAHQEKWEKRQTKEGEA